MLLRAIIPLKALSAAKGRLSGALDAVEREALVAWMATHVVHVCLACDAIDEVLVVAGDEDAADVARRAGATVMLVTQPGLTEALDAADAVSASCTATIVVAADLPELTVDDLVAVIAAGGAEGPVVVVARTHDGGTGALLRRPPGVIATAYGADSGATHIAAARGAGVGVVAVAREGLARDVDTPDQLPPALAWRQHQVVGSAPPPRRTEESACRKAP